MKKYLALLSGTVALMVTAVAPAPASAADTEISFIVCGDKLYPKYADYIAEWEKANAGYKIAPEVVGWEQCQDKVTTLAAAGTPPSLAYVGSRTLKQFASNDLIVPVPMSDAEKAAYYPNVADTVTFDGKQWGVPVAFSTKALYWNKDLFKKAGLDPEVPPKTWAEEIAMAKQIKEKTGIAGFGVVAKTFDNTMHQFMHWVYTNNGSVIDATSGKITFDSPQVLAALTALKDITPYAEEGPTAYEQNEVRAIFLDGKLGMIQGGVGAVVRLADTKVNWGVTNLPLGPDAKGPGTLLITDSLAVFSGTGVEEKATEFAKFITEPSRQFPYELAEGLTPLRPSKEVDALIAAKPHWKPFVDGIAFGGPEPLFLDYKSFQNAVIEMVQSVVTGKAEPQAALTKAAKTIEQYK